MTSRSSYEGMRVWLNELRKSVNFNVVVVAIVALKVDLLNNNNTTNNNNNGKNSSSSASSEVVPTYEVEQLAQALNVMYIPTSSKLDVNVTCLFQRVAEEVLERRKRGLVLGYNHNHLIVGGIGGIHQRSSGGQQQLGLGGGIGGGGVNNEYSSGTTTNSSSANNETTTTSLSPMKDLYGKYYEKNDNSKNSNHAADFNNDHRDDSDENDGTSIDTFTSPSQSDYNNHNKNGNNNNKRRRSSHQSNTPNSSSNTTTVAGAVMNMIKDPLATGVYTNEKNDIEHDDDYEEEEEGAGGGDITMDDVNTDDGNNNSGGEEDGGEYNGSFFMMCGNPTWCGKPSDTIE